MTITTAAELDALPVGSVVLSEPDAGGYRYPFERLDEGWYLASAGLQQAELPLPLTVLYRPDRTPAEVKGYILVGRETGEADWDADIHPTVEAARASFSGVGYHGGVSASVVDYDIYAISYVARADEEAQP